MRTSRRRFLKQTGTGVAGTWLAAVAPSHAGAQESIRKSFDPRITQEFVSVCRQCPAACGVAVEVLDGKVKRLRGNPLHPTNRGTLCARGIAATQLYYNPDRITGPLRRIGERGAGQWEPIEWTEAFEILAERLQTLRAANQPHTLAFLADQMYGLEGVLARRLCQAYGTPNFLDLSQHPTEAVVNAAGVMQGIDGPILFDIAHATFLVSFNVPFLETSRNPLQTWQQFATFRAGKRRARGHFVHFSPTRDVTAAKADEWIPIRPGTEGALALGMVYVLLQEGLYDHDFVKYHAHGFENWRTGGENFPGFQEHVRRNYKPGQVADKTGVPVDKIVRLAREFALAQAPLALWQDARGIPAQPLATQMAIHSLNALVGNIDLAGGVLVPRPLPVDLTAGVVQDDVGRAGWANGSLVAVEHTQFTAPGIVPSSFPERVHVRSPYPVELVFIYRANPVFEAIDSARYVEALHQIPFSACIASHHNETTMLCDLILPESHALESWYAGINHTGAGYPVFNLAEPVVPPRYDSMHVGDMVLELARRVGGSVAKSLPWARFQDVAYAYATQINALQAGDVFGRSDQETWTRLLERIGWRARTDTSDEEFWRACLASGGWWDPIYFHKDWERAFRTESRRFEFFPKILWAQLRRFRAGAAVTEEDKAGILPHYVAESPSAAGEDYPFALLVSPLVHLTHVESPNQPWLQELTGTLERDQWRTWVALNPEDAHHLHLVEGAPVRVESERGAIEVPCRFDEGVQPGTVRMPFGLGHTAGGRWVKDISVSPAHVVAQAHDPQVGEPDWQRTRVRIRKV